jgi:hypothetical protein
VAEAVKAEDIEEVKEVEDSKAEETGIQLQALNNPR